MTETYCDQHKVEKNEEITDFVRIPFVDMNGEPLSVDTIDFAYTHHDIETIRMEWTRKPSKLVQDNLQKLYWIDDIKEYIEIETGRSIFGDLNFID